MAAIPIASGTCANSVTFVSAGAAAARDPELVNHGRPLVAVRGTRGLTRSSLARNRATAPIEVDVRDGTVTLDGQPLAVDPVPWARLRNYRCHHDEETIAQALHGQGRAEPLLA